MSSFTEQEKQILRDIVDQSIQYGLQYGQPLPINPKNFSDRLIALGASFVTLEINGSLRGCIGSLEAYRPLVIDVAENAYAAAFLDPRFSSLNKDEYSHLTKHISILSKPIQMHFSSEEELLNQIQPNIDGLILTEQGHRGTFLPSVWESLSDKYEFLRHLKMKAGLAPDYWSDTIRIARYTTEML